MFDFAVLAIGRADEADRITAVPLNFEMKGQRFAFNGHQISRLASNNQVKTIQCMATNEIQNGCGLSIDAALASNQKRRCVYINTLMIQKVLAQPHWQGKLTPRDHAAPTPLILEHVDRD